MSIFTPCDGARNRLALPAVFKPGDLYLNIRAGREQSTPWGTDLVKVPEVALSIALVCMGWKSEPQPPGENLNRNRGGIATPHFPLCGDCFGLSPEACISCLLLAEHTFIILLLCEINESQYKALWALNGPKLVCVADRGQSINRQKLICLVKSGLQIDFLCELSHSIDWAVGTDDGPKSSAN